MAGAPSTTIWLMRHGETDWNVERRLQGQMEPGPPLNALGRQQVQALSSHLVKLVKDRPPGSPPCTAIYSSDSLRAVETAEAAAQQLQLPVHQQSNLRERNLGVLTGLTYTTAPEMQPAAWAQLQQGGRGTRIDGGGESLDDLQQRAAAALQQLADRHPGQLLLLVSHGGFLQSVHHAVRGYASKSKVLNCSLAVLQIPSRGSKLGGNAGGCSTGDSNGQQSSTAGDSDGMCSSSTAGSSSCSTDREGGVIPAAAAAAAAALQPHEQHAAHEVHPLEQRRGQQAEAQAQPSRVPQQPEPSKWALLQWNVADFLAEEGVEVAVSAFGGGARDA